MFLSSYHYGPGRVTLYTLHKSVTRKQYSDAAKNSGILGQLSRQLIRQSARITAERLARQAKREALRLRLAARLRA